MGAAPSRSVAKTDAVIKAAVNNIPDSTLSNNLKKLGQVNVQSPGHLQRSIEMTHVIRTRALSESEEQPQTSTIDAYGLSELFDARKDKKNTQMLSQRYKLDTKVLERLAKRYNTPSVASEYTINLPDGDMRTYKQAVWLE